MRRTLYPRHLTHGRACLATQYSSMRGSLVWWNMSGSSVERLTFSPREKNS